VKNSTECKEGMDTGTRFIDSSLSGSGEIYFWIRPSGREREGLEVRRAWWGPRWERGGEVLGGSPSYRPVSDWKLLLKIKRGGGGRYFEMGSFSTDGQADSTFFFIGRLSSPTLLLYSLVQLSTHISSTRLMHFSGSLLPERGEWFKRPRSQWTDKNRKGSISGEPGPFMALSINK
jgi:hypothetical protein